MKRLLAAFLASLLAMAVAPALAQSKKGGVALLIGNATYPDAESSLKEPVKDARALGDELRRRGFDIDIGENLTKEGMRRALDRFYERISENATAVIFFSGYGIQSNRQTYMIPVNAQIWSEPDVRRDGFNLDTVLSEMNGKGAHVKIAILDASRRNPYERRFRSHSAGLAAITAPKSTVVMSSATPGAVMDDGSAGTFMLELLKEMRVSGAMVEQIFNRTRMDVSRATNGTQVPWFSSSLDEEVAFEPTTSSGRVATEKPRPTESSQAGSSSAAEREYASADRLGTRKGWEDFLKKYPSGYYADLARDKVDRLTSSSSQPDSTSAAGREYASAERLGTRKGWEDFLRKYPSGYYANLARDQLDRLDRPTSSERPSRPSTSLASVDPAIRDLDDRIKAAPNDTGARYRRGQMLAKRGDYSRAVEDFDEVIRLNSQDADALNNRCFLRAVLDEPEAALKDCNQALRIKPGFVDALDSRGLVELKLGMYTEAIVDYDAALRTKPRLASALYGRGFARLKRGSVSGGNSDIAAAKSIQPNIADEFAAYGIR